MKFVAALLMLVSLDACMSTTPIVTPSAQLKPLVLYTDIASGPSSGGENNKGIYLSIFGKNFGSSINFVRVYINNLEVRNNIFVPAAKTRYVIDVNGGFLGDIGVVSNNLWFGGTDTNPATSFSSNSSQSNPGFAAANDFHLVAGSGAIDKATALVSGVVKDDYDVATGSRSPSLRPQNALFDIGAFEY